jgi:octaheme c-type cytochrome (tetrathionate reductase family)
VGLLGIVLVILVPIFLFLPKGTGASKDPYAGVPAPVTHTDHTNIVTGTFTSGQQVTQACLECHPDAADQVMHTTHWTWESEPVQLPWRDEPVTIGKINQINNFCIGAAGNERTCTSCHAGYGWEETPANLSKAENVDCLACHADTNVYAKGNYGNPAEGVDLLAAAQSVRSTTRDNCGKCHFDGGGGNGVKHGDLDESLYFPKEALDVHMGRLDFQCTACHKTEGHAIRGKMISVSVDAREGQVACTDCHAPDLHADERINAHVDTVACQTCHIPVMATKDPTKTYWDWSTAGQDLPEDHYTYLKIKGNFVYDTNVQPEYRWYNETDAYRYILGDTIVPSQTTNINLPGGAIDDPTARIFPFKVHIARQPYDTVNKTLLPVLTSGEGGFWTTFDWPSALKLGAEKNGLEFSGEYGFAETAMYWPTTHMVQPAASALQCEDCHGENGRLDWEALGYPGDPIDWGSRVDKSSTQAAQNNGVNGN